MLFIKESSTQIRGACSFWASLNIFLFIIFVFSLPTSLTWSAISLSTMEETYILAFFGIAIYQNNRNITVFQIMLFSIFKFRTKYCLYVLNNEQPGKTLKWVTSIIYVYKLLTLYYIWKSVASNNENVLPCHVHWKLIIFKYSNFPLNMQIINDDDKLCNKLTKSYHIHQINCIFNCSHTHTLHNTLFSTPSAESVFTDSDFLQQWTQIR